MQIPALPHDWNVTPTAAIGIQRQLALHVRTDMSLPLEQIRFVGGVDVSSTRFDTLLTAGIIIWDRMTGEVIEKRYHQAAATFPYIPGFLSFREIPVLLKAAEQIEQAPDVLLVDGQGIAHPRRLGIASHLGIFLDRPTIGVAKSRLIGTYEEPGPTPGDLSGLFDGQEQIGVVLRTRARSNPLFLSPGHRIDLSSSMIIVKACFRGYRLPEPTRLAHLFVKGIATGSHTDLQRTFEEL